jgi:hypothetical protein
MSHPPPPSADDKDVAIALLTAAYQAGNPLRVLGSALAAVQAAGRTVGGEVGQMACNSPASHVQSQSAHCSNIIASTRLVLAAEGASRHAVRGEVHLRAARDNNVDNALAASGEVMPPAKRRRVGRTSSRKLCMYPDVYVYGPVARTATQFRPTVRKVDGSGEHVVVMNMLGNSSNVLGFPTWHSGKSPCEHSRQCEQ